jgi:hypothetical protein
MLSSWVRACFSDCCGSKTILSSVNLIFYLKNNNNQLPMQPKLKLIHWQSRPITWVLFMPSLASPSVVLFNSHVFIDEVD